MAKFASEAKDAVLPPAKHVYLEEKKLLLVPLEVLREDCIAREELMLCYRGNVHTSPILWNSSCTCPHILPQKSWQH